MILYNKNKSGRKRYNNNIIAGKCKIVYFFKHLNKKIFTFPPWNCLVCYKIIALYDQYDYICVVCAYRGNVKTNSVPDFN
jgi:formate-dependent nitrite reductase cytochrome c552 subunit